MISPNIQPLIHKIQGFLTSQPIERAWLFGSSSRGEEHAQSDIDLMVRYDQHARITLFTISRIMLQLKELTGKNIDLVEEGCLQSFASKSANQDKILIYERKDKR